MTDDRENVEAKYQRLKAHLQGLGRVIVAFSGGVDSTLLLRVSRDVLGENVLAVSVVSETMPDRDREAAARFALEIGVPYMTVPTDELFHESFRTNPVDRCYYCKRLRFGHIVRIGAKKGVAHILDGENIDDLDDYRPGRRAARELGIISPLREAGFSKKEVRILARRLGLGVWNRPASACLASRIPHGMAITAERLRRIDCGEMFLRDAGISSEIRVRLIDDRSARIEIPTGDLDAIVREPFRSRIVAFFKDLGFRRIAVDLEGYRTGSLNPERSPDGVGEANASILADKGGMSL